MTNLRIPGPTPVPPSVLQSMTKQMVDHRGPAFAKVLNVATERLKEFFQTTGDVLIFPSSGTGAMEAAVVNTLSPSDRVLAVSIGAFGDRFAEIAATFGADVVKLDFPWGTAADHRVIGDHLRKDPSIKAVLVTHNETSTGVTNDLESIAEVVRPHQALLIVDAISSIGAIDLPVDTWGCDVVVTGSQKSWMIPPGISIVSVSENAWKAHRRAKMPRYYWDFTAAKKYLEKGQTPYTPAVSLFYALDESLRLMDQEGHRNIIERHRRLGAFFRNGARELGLELLASERYASNIVTAIMVPPGIKVKDLRRILREDHGVVVAAGQGALTENIFRVGHVGYVSKEDLEDVLESLKATLPRLGFHLATESRA
ncbi:MAG: alanine--glyoxylate aminotransferase family protein [Chloroflexi bacterium]|nr:alanine--glyoxylate aminotransferase family protein [Chloroflexota bacterium]